MSSQKERPVALTPADREELVRVTTTGVHPASMIRRARVLLALDTSGGVEDPKEVWVQVFPVTPATLLAWHRTLANRQYAPTRRPRGRPRTPASARALTLEIQPWPRI